MEAVIDWDAEEFPSGQPTVVEQFEARATATPGATAIVDPDGTLTYHELNVGANRLAHHLRTLGVGPEVVVAVCVERSAAMVVALLGVLKAGGAYLPLDPGYPGQRLAFMLTDAHAPVLITEDRLLHRLPAAGSTVVCLDRDSELIDGNPITNPPPAGLPTNLAYLIYTSGSSGAPKATMLEHRGLSNLVAWHVRRYGVVPSDRASLLAAIGFDASVWELWPYLAAGASIAIPDDTVRRSPEAVCRWLAASAVTVAFLPTPLAEAVLQLDEAESAPLRWLLTGGDRLTRHPRPGLPFTLVNHYGPTECTVVATATTVGPSGSRAAPPIGTPIDGTTAHVLDDALDPVPDGVAGELYIGGVGVGRGYLGHPALTAERFLPDPFSGDRGARLYRTGDLVSRRADGNLEFLGRLDDQVKVRGFRIELGEVESALASHPAVRQAVVAARADRSGDTRLVAYVVGPADGPGDDSGRATDEWVAQWKGLYEEQVYGDSGADDVDPTFDIRGWMSTYTGEPIPAEEMAEWVDTTVERVLALRPARVLEVGCGTGLVLWRVAPHCDAYVGTDFSARTVERLRHHLAQRALSNVQVVCQEAAELSEAADGGLDTVVVNSVIQYFPNLEYLERVLDQAVAAVAGGGAVFVGDVRSKPLLQAFWTSVELSRAEPSTPLDVLRERVERRLAQENELVVDPRFFTQWARRRPEVSHVEVLPRRGRHRNELSAFRYDVVLHVGAHQAPRAVPRWLDWEAEGLSLAALREIVASSGGETVGVRGVPNDRVVRDVRAVQLLATDGAATAGDLRQALSECGGGVEPEDLLALGEELDRTVCWSWASSSERGSLDVAFLSGSASERVVVAFPEAEPTPGDPLATDPAGRLSSPRGSIAQELRAHLRAMLPAHMVPAAFVVLDALPLTPNGKVDRRALPAPPATRPESGPPYVAPRSAVEEALAAIWAEVLGLELVGRDDHFFDLGGDSLSATRVAGRTAQALGVDLPVGEVFERPILAELALAVEARGGAAHAPPPLVARARADQAPLSFAQERLWFLDQLVPGNPAYTVPVTYRVTGPLDVGALEGALSGIVARHDTLRTTFVAVDGRPRQRVAPPGRVGLEVVDLSHLDPAEAEAQGRRLAGAEVSSRFQLDRGPLFRARVLRLAADDHVLLLTMHHIVSDEWSIGVLTRQLCSLYAAFCRGETSPLRPPALQYADFAAWQREWLGGGVLEAQLAYWKGRLAGAPPALELPTDRPRPPIPSHRGASHRFHLYADLTRSLGELAHARGATTFMTLLAALEVVLARYAGTDDVVVGTVVAGRPRPELEELIGFFVNTLVLRTDLSGDPSFLDALERVRETALGAFSHQDVPFEQLVAELEPVRDLSRNPLVQVVVEYFPRQGDTFAMSESTVLRDLGGLTGAEYGEAAGGATVRFDLELFLTDSVDGGVDASVVYATDLFDAETISRLVSHFLTVLRAIVDDPARRLAELPLLSEAERHQLLVQWASNPTDFPDVPVHEQVEARAARTPDAPAVAGAEAELTYAELDARANRLAHHLRSLGVGPEVVVGVCLPRSAELVVALLAVLKAGGAYLPLDPDQPAERLGYMLGDAGAPVVVTDAVRAALLPATGVGPMGAKVVLVDADAAAIAANPSTPVASGAGPDHLAYVIYTSGSTGRPKGTLLCHRGLSNLVAWHVARYGVGPGDCGSMLASLGFDAAVWELWPYLAAGARVAVGPEEVRRSPEAVARWLADAGVTVAFLATPLAEAVLADPDIAPSLPLRALLTGGDRLSRYPDAGLPFDVVNHYGPTEATVVATAATVPPGPGAPVAPSIGRPIGNTTAYVLDANLEPVPVHVTGELYLGGVSLARGYLGRAALTADRFVPDPFGPPGCRLYRTGDLARWRPDGELDFVGRADDQVKVRGFRIEPGEVEAALVAHPDVAEAVVVARDDPTAGRRLVAYVAGGALPATAELRGHLQARLPDYMVPAAIVALDALPLTAHGKVDRAALPAPADARPNFDGDHVAPSTPVEKALAEVWAEVLGLDRVGSTDNFFELGGDSILSIQVVSRARQRGIHISPRDMFERQTVAELAAVAAEALAAGGHDRPVSGPFPLTPIQRWFLERDLPDPGHFSQSVLLEVPPGTDAGLVQAALAHLLAHHDALRLRVRRNGAGWHQEVVPVDELDASSWFQVERVTTGSSFDEDAVAEAEAEAVAARADGPMNLAAPPLWRATLLDLGSSRPGRLLVTVHHLAVDVVSWRILLDDLDTAYAQLEAGQPVQLPARTTSIATWARRLADLAASGAFDDEVDYWLERDGAQGLALPVDDAGGANTVASQAEVTVVLGEDSTRALVQEVPGRYRVRVNEAVLAALVEAVAGSSIGSSAGASASPSPGPSAGPSPGRALLVDLEGHGREDLWDDVDLSRTVGWFTTVAPVLVELPDEPGPGATLKAVKEELRAVPRRGLGYGVLRYLGRPDVARRLAAQSPPDVAFNYLGQLDVDLAGRRRFPLAAGDPVRLAQSPAVTRAHLLEIDAWVTGGRLVIKWGYSTNVHHDDTMRALASAHLAELEAIVAHCRAPGAGGVTPSDFPLARLDQRRLDALVGTGQHVADLYPLTPLQQGLLFHAILERDNDVYVEQLAWLLDGSLDGSALARAWQDAVDAHPVLRTGFAWEGLDRPLQVVHRHGRLAVEEHDWRGTGDGDGRDRLEELMAAVRRRGFELTRPPLLRVDAAAVADGRHWVVVTFHHIVLDGWSLSLLLGEVFARYEAHRRGQRPPPGAAPRPFRDYLAWLDRQDRAGAEQFWRRYLSGRRAPTPLGLPRPEAPQPGHTTAEVRLSVSDTEALQRFARRHRLTLNTVVVGAWAVLLSRYSGENDVVFGVTSSGRPPDLAGAESMLGLLINTVPVRALVTPDAPVARWLSELQRGQTEVRQFEHASLVDIQGWSDVPRSEEPFESLLVFENYPVESSVESAAPSLDVRSTVMFERTNYPLTLAVVPGTHLQLHAIGDLRRLEPAVVSRLVSHLATLLRGVAADTERPLSELPVLTEIERAELLVEWNATASGARAETCVHELVGAQAQQHPAAPAVVDGDRSLSYGELNAAANRLAHRLIALGIGAEHVVAVCLPRSAELVTTLLAVLKAGAAYLPLDPAYPAARLGFMLSDAAVPVVVTRGEHVARLPVERDRLLCLDEEALPPLDHDPPPRAQPANLAYVIYTSGSTGTPKGVMVEHRGLSNLVAWHLRRYSVTPADRAPLVASLGFDASVWELWPYLAAGTTVVVPDDDARQSPGALCRWLETNGVTIAFLPTPMAEAVLVTDDAQRLPLRALLTGGDKLTRRPDPSVPFTLVNHYGPTECTVVATAADVAPRPSAAASAAAPPIGRPIDNTTAYVLDGHLQPVPVGMTGELFLGGAGLARGYLGRPDLTAERFVPHPFTGARLYRTGDLVRYRADGNLDFVGRADDQVKIRGFRIEPGEVEAALLTNPAVDEAVVVARDDPGRERQLVAYIVPRGLVPNASELRAHLRAALPDHMVPAAFVALAALPLTSNGKIDRASLPAPTTTRPALDSAYVAPDTPTEEVLAAVWSEVLGVERVGSQDNFFDLGGHSLLAIQAVASARERLGVEVPLHLLFEAPTVADLAAVLAADERLRHLPAPPLVALPRTPGFRAPLSLTQEQMWSFETQADPPGLYNGTVHHRFAAPVNVDAVQGALEHLVRRHEALRTRFPVEDGRPCQRVEASVVVDLGLSDLSGLGPEERAKALRALMAEENAEAFDLAVAPLFRARLCDLGEEGAELVLTFDHLVCDGTSLTIFLSELEEVYSALAAGEVPSLAPLPIRFADFAAWQRSWLTEERLQGQCDYWRRKLAQTPLGPGIPFDRLPTSRPRRVAFRDFTIAPATYARLARLARASKGSLFTVAVAAVQSLIACRGGRTDTVVTTLTSGRYRHELEGVFGLFAGIARLRIDLSGDPTFETVLTRARATVLEMFEHQDVPFRRVREAILADLREAGADLSKVGIGTDPATLPVEVQYLRAARDTWKPGMSVVASAADEARDHFFFRGQRHALIVSFVDGGSQLWGRISYKVDFFDASTIESLAADLERLLAAVADDWQLRLSELPVAKPAR